MAGLTGWHLLVLVLIILLLFGAAKLPALAKSMGQSARVFKGEMKAMKEEDAASPQQTTADSTATSTVHENPSTQPRKDGGAGSTPTT
jgi:sec-independent protein translocase protein TatA